MGFPGTRLIVIVAAAAFVPAIAHADRIENGVAIFSALDKVTAHISTFEAPLGKTQTFGALKVTPRACYSRPPTEQPKTTTFVEVDEVQLDGSEKRIFTGWMFAESPGLYGVEHPTFDVWLTECQSPLKATAQKTPDSAADGPLKTGEKASVTPQPSAKTGAQGAQPVQADPETSEPAEPRRRFRR